MKDIVTVEEAAQFLHKHPDTIRRWIEQKILKARHLSAGGHGIYAILRSDLLELAISGSIEAKEKEKKIHFEVSPGQRTLLPTPAASSTPTAAGKSPAAGKSGRKS